MQLTGQVLGACVIILCYNLCTCEHQWEDEDTIIVEAAAEENIGSSSKDYVATRIKRQIGSMNSIFAGVPGWGMLGNGFGNAPNLGGLPGFGNIPGIGSFGGFQLPGFSGGMHGVFQLPIQHQPTMKPVKPVESSCYTSNGEVGECAQFRQCYPLLFSTAEDEQRNPGLAYILKTSAGHCASETPEQNNKWWYNSETLAKQSQICCSDGSQRPVVSTTAAPSTHATSTWGPAWPPQSHFDYQTTTTPTPPTQSTTWGPPAWPPQFGHLTQPTTTMPPTQRTTWGPPGWPPHFGHQTLPTTTTSPTQKTTWGSPAWPPHFGHQTESTTTMPPTQITTWGPPAWPPHFGHQTQSTTTMPPTQRTTWGPPAWPPQSHFGHFTQATTQSPVEPYNCPGLYIIGGVPVQGRSYPYIVSIKDGRTDRHLCGGSLLSARSVLTAAHCVKQLGPQQVAGLRAHLGANDVASTFNNGCTVVRKVRNIKYHRGFSMRTLHDDIAILTLESAVPTGGNIQTVSLAGNRVAPGGKATVAGWGGLHLGGQPVGSLRHVTLDIISNDLCAAKYVGSAPAGITQHMLCAGSAGRDACLGDSGGPLIMNGQQVGIVSFGTGCGTLPGVYTRVSSYISWINKNTT